MTLIENETAKLPNLKMKILLKIISFIGISLFLVVSIIVHSVIKEEVLIPIGNVTNQSISFFKN